LLEDVNNLIRSTQPLDRELESLDLLMSVDVPEVWAAGVTYARSKEARNYEATDGKMNAITFYDKVYDAERPKLFLKSTATIKNMLNELRGKTEVESF
jgi:2-dehydro-3-deoxy-D-arabinonate dehydratase